MAGRRILTALLLAALLCSCTKSIDSGSYGPFVIGESKRGALRKAKEFRRHIKPLPFPEIQIANPSRDDLEELSGRSGVLVWIEGLPNPIRIEFSNKLVVRTWPQFRADISHHSTIPLLIALQDVLPPGTTEGAAFDAITAIGAEHHVRVGVFVVGYQQFRIGDTESAAFDDLLMANDAWRFDGLKEELWFDPFYSRATLYFEGEELNRIEHYWFPVEMP